MLLNILQYPDPRLRNKAKPVTEFDEKSLQATIDDMLETMYEGQGIGLAAIQVNIQQRIIVMDLQPNGKPEPLYLINPEILEQDGEQVTMEGCLSVPDAFEKVKRAKHLKVRSYNIDGSTREFEADGLFADCIQHEIDHLNGKLFIDRVSPIKREKIRKVLLKHRKNRM